MNATARWMLEGGPAPAGLQYNPGFIARVDVKSGKVTYVLFNSQRPASLTAVDETLFLLTEGTVDAMFSDGLLRKNEAYDNHGQWQTLVVGLALPSRLRKSGELLFPPDKL